jgi:hypothetical protein
MGIYATVAEVRGEPEVPDAAPPSDVDVESLITQAEDQIDNWLGGWPIQTTGPSAGRKIAQVDVEAWQWAKLKRATVRLAARLHASPTILTGREWGTIEGPDFKKSQPIGGASAPAQRLPDVVSPLNASGLRALAARATA